MKNLTTLALITVSCSSNKNISRVDETKQIDLSGRWNDTDSVFTFEIKKGETVFHLYNSLESIPLQMGY